MDFQSIIVELLTEEKNDLIHLAKIAGEDPSTFYRTANFRDADLSSEDLSLFDLSSSSVAHLVGDKADREWDTTQSEETKPVQVRMSTVLSVYVHEIFSERFPRRLSFELEHRIWLILENHLEAFLDELNHGKIRQEATNSLNAMNTSHPEAEHRFAYTFSSELRDRIYEIAEENYWGSGYILSSLIYYIFVFDEEYSWGQLEPRLIEFVQKNVASKYADMM